MKPYGYIILNTITGKFLSGLGDWSETLSFHPSRTRWSDSLNSSLVLKEKKKALSIKKSILKSFKDLEVLPIHLSRLTQYDLV